MLHFLAVVSTELEQIQDIVTWIIGIVAPVLVVLAAAVFKLWKDNKEVHKDKDALQREHQKEKDELQREFRQELTEVYAKTTEVSADIANAMKQQIETLRQIDHNSDELESALKSVAGKVTTLADQVKKLRGSKS